MEALWETITTAATNWGPAVISAVADAYRRVDRHEDSEGCSSPRDDARQVDPTLIGFLTSLFYIGAMTLVVVSAVGKLGVETLSFVAVLGAAGLAVGFALQGSLANFAAGVLLIIFRRSRSATTSRREACPAASRRFRFSRRDSKHPTIRKPSSRIRRSRAARSPTTRPRNPPGGPGLRHRLRRRHQEGQEHSRGHSRQGRSRAQRPGTHHRSQANWATAA